MKILALHAENVKKLKVVDITPTEDVVILSGANEQGKTSALDAIQYALDGGESLKAVRQPMRKGSEKAITQVTLGDGEPTYKVTRTWTANDKSYLKVESADGAKYPSPQKMLDGMIGKLAFDPLQFSSMKDKDQRDTLLGLVDIGIDLDKWAKDRKETFDERTAVNRTVTELQGQIAGLPIVPEDTPTEEVSAATILGEQREAQAVISANKAKVREWHSQLNDVTEMERDCEKVRGEIESLVDRLEKARALLASMERDLTTESEKADYMKDACSQLVDPDLSTFDQRISEVEATNNLVRTLKRRRELDSMLAARKKVADTLTATLLTMDGQKMQALAAAKMPVDGLSFDETGIYYQGTPFNQCSSEERLRVSAAMGMALNPKLRVMFIRDGSLLDTKHREIMAQMAKDNDYQLWMEVTDDTGKVGLVFEDGEIVNGKD